MSVATLRRGVVIERSVPMRDGIELILHEPEAAMQAKPGQFFQLAVETPGTLLRRPYSVAWTDPDRGRIAFIFSVVGAGSAWLAARESGQPVELLGPLGTGFDAGGHGRAAVCVAGGLGIAAFPALVALLVAAGRRVTVLLGARSAERLLPRSRLAGAEVRVATDDGSQGYHGPVTGLLPGIFDEDVGVFTCGPTPMLRAVVQASRRRGFPLERIQVALETPMGCGIGTCLGCVAPRMGGGYLLTCQDGPCISADRIDWERVSDAFHGG